MITAYHDFINKFISKCIKPPLRQGAFNRSPIKKKSSCVKYNFYNKKQLMALKRFSKMKDLLYIPVSMHKQSDKELLTSGRVLNEGKAGYRV